MFSPFKGIWARATESWTLLPVLISNLCSLGGLLLLDWSVADIFFWFWAEFVLSGVTTFVLLMFWRRVDKHTPRDIVKLAPYLFGFGFLMVLFYASAFAGMAYMAEWKSWSHFPSFLADKKIGLMLTTLSFITMLGMTVAKPDYGIEESNRVTLQFGRRAWVIVTFYALTLIHGWIGEWTGAWFLKPPLAPAYVKGMGIALLALKSSAEVGIFDRLFKRREKRP